MLFLYVPLFFTSIFHFFLFETSFYYFISNTSLFLNVTYGKIFARYEISLIVYFANFSLANIINILCRLQNSTVTHSFLVSKKRRNSYIFKTNFFFWRHSPMLKSCRNKYYFIECTSVIVL